MNKILSDIKYIFKTYHALVWILFGSFFFAGLGDLFYGGTEGAKDSLIGIILTSVSSFFFSLFIIIALITAIMTVMRSGIMNDIFRNLSETKKGAKK